MSPEVLKCCGWHLEVCDQMKFFTLVCDLGKEYAVKVCIHRLPNGEWPYPYMRVGLFVDSLDVQYWKRLDLTTQEMRSATSVTASFWGFKKDSSNLNAFVFSNPSLSSGDSYSAQLSEVGQIKAIIHEAVVGEGVFQNVSGSFSVPTVPSAVVEGKKFWQQASVSGEFTVFSGLFSHWMRMSSAIYFRWPIGL
jgi:hypothetical protein